MDFNTLYEPPYGPVRTGWCERAGALTLPPTRLRDSIERLIVFFEEDLLFGEAYFERGFLELQN